MSGLVVEIRLEQFERVKQCFPAKAYLLEQIVEFTPTHVIIPLESISPGILEDIGTDVINKLYALATLVDENQFLSYYYQVGEVFNLLRNKSKKLLEIGSGNGIFPAFVRSRDYDLTTIDVHPPKKPDVLGSALALPFQKGSFDLICSFEILQHMPYGHFIDALRQITDITCDKAREH